MADKNKPLKSTEPKALVIHFVSKSFKIDKVQIELNKNQVSLIAEVLKADWNETIKQLEVLERLEKYNDDMLKLQNRLQLLKLMLADLKDYF